MNLKPGVVRQGVNFECGVTGGYTYLSGYERKDGRPSPSEQTGQILGVSAVAYTPVVGDAATDGTATGVVAYVNGTRVGLCKISGTFSLGATLSAAGNVVGTINDLYAGPVTPREEAVFSGSVADIYRADIQAVPGSGPVRGVVMYNDVVYAFRNNVGGTACDIYKTTSSGWSKVPLYYSVSFTVGGTATPADGATLTQGGVTATVKRVVRSSGSWSGSPGTAAGRLIITSPSGGNFASGSATLTGGATVTLSGAQTQIAILPGGKYEFAENNFSGATATKRVYGCDGVNAAFEFDGDVYVPILTGTTPDAPSHVAAHRNYLWLSIGSSFFGSAPGLPYDWTSLSSAVGEIAVGDDVTGMVVMPGSETRAALGVFSRTNTYILYGTTKSDFTLVTYNTGSGALPFTLANMSQTFAFDDRGVVSIQATLQYGNFSQSAITSNIVPFINSHINQATYATLNRRKSQYRVFFSDGTGLYCTVVNGKTLGVMPVSFPDPVFCAYEGKTSSGIDVNFFGSTNGYVYQLDKGTSFDGANIDSQIILNFSSASSSRTLKRYRRAAVEIETYDSSYIEMQFGFALGYSDMRYEQPGTDQYSLYLSNSSWDSFTWDTFFWDTNGVSPVECWMSGTAENVGLSFSCNSNYMKPFTINSIMIHYSPRRTMR